MTMPANPGQTAVCEQTEEARSIRGSSSSRVLGLDQVLERLSSLVAQVLVFDDPDLPP